jgi:D-alanyl-D-alanine carboxypeptidase
MSHPSLRTPTEAGEHSHRARVVLGLVIVAALLVIAAALGRPLVSAVAEGDPRPGVADGYVDAGSPIPPTADVPAIDNLRPALRDALRAAARDAQADGVAVLVTSGWRDQRYQDWLHEQAVARGGEQEASELVAAGSTSRHLTGEAVDVGPTDADSWMQQHGNRYGLCQIYANESWHYELATTPGGGCPPSYPDARSRP